MYVYINSVFTSSVRVYVYIHSVYINRVFSSCFYYTGTEITCLRKCQIRRYILIAIKEGQKGPLLMKPPTQNVVSFGWILCMYVRIGAFNMYMSIPMQVLVGFLSSHDYFHMICCKVLYGYCV